MRWKSNGLEGVVCLQLGSVRECVCVCVCWRDEWMCCIMLVSRMPECVQGVGVGWRSAGLISL